MFGKILVSKAYMTPVKVVLLTVISISFSVFTNYLLAKYISPEQYGSWRLFLTITSFSGLLHFGLIDGITIQWLFSQTPEWHNTAKRDFSYLFIQQILLYFIIIISLSSPLFSEIIRLGSLPILLANQIVLQNIAGLIAAFFTCCQKFYYSSLFVLGGQVVFCIMLVLYQLKYIPVLNLDLFSNIQVAITTIPMLYVVYRQTKEWRSPKWVDFSLSKIIRSINKSIRIGLPILSTGLLFLGFINIDKLLVLKYYSAHKFGLYTFGAALLNTFLTVGISIANFLMKTLVPIRNSLGMYYNKAVTRILQLVCLLLISIVPLQLLINNFMPNYAGSVIYIKYMSGFIGPYLLVYLLQFSIFKLIKKQQAFFGLSIIVFGITTLILFILSISQITLTTIACTSALMAYVWFLTGDWVLSSLLPECKSKQLKRCIFMVFSICLYLLMCNINVV